MRSIEKKLLKTFAQLTASQQDTLLGFAEFLINREAETETADIAVPELLERPENESVVAAIKRLKVSYPMVGRETVFEKTSMLMTQHIMQGRAAIDVIDELEVMFQEHYLLLISDDT